VNLVPEHVPKKVSTLVSVEQNTAVSFSFGFTVERFKVKSFL